MNRRRDTLCACLLFVHAAAHPLTDAVNTLFGTRGSGGLGGWGCPQVNPGAAFPFPAMRLGPDTTHLEAGPGSLETWAKFNRKGGYFGADHAISCFSHTHLQGAGMSDYGNIGAMIVRNASLASLVAVVPVEVDDLVYDGRSPWASRFNKSTEYGRPGYYAADLTDAGARAEVTVSGPRAGMHRYTCGAAPAAPCTFVLDACHNTHTGVGGCGATGTTHQNIAFDALTHEWLVEVTVNNTGEFATTDATGVLVYFVARIGANVPDANATAWGLWADRELLPPGPAAAGASNASLGAYVTWHAPPPGSSVTVTVRAGLSWTSVEDAWANLVAEQQPGGNASDWLSFDACVASADAAWENVLSSVKITASNGAAAASVSAGLPYAPSIDGNVSVFYTALYHSFLGASTYSNADGSYLGFDAQRHILPPQQRAFLSDLSLWDIHRTMVPLTSVLLPSAAADMSQSLLAMAAQGGHLPRWPFANLYTDIMNAEHGIEVLLDCLLKSACGGQDGRAAVNASVVYDVVAAAIARQAVGPYSTLGYVPFEVGRTSQTLEFAANDASASRVATLAGRAEDAAMLLNRSRSWRNVWRSDITTMAPRWANGSFVNVTESVLREVR